MSHRFLCIFLIAPLLTVFPLSLNAQENVSASVSENLEHFGRPRYMLYFFESEEETLSDEQTFILYSSILTTIAEANDDVVIVESPDTAVPWNKEGKEELAQRVNADCWIAVNASGGFENLTVTVDIFDILRQKNTGEIVIRPGFVTEFRTIAMAVPPLRAMTSGTWPSPSSDTAWPGTIALAPKAWMKTESSNGF